MQISFLLYFFHNIFHMHVLVISIMYWQLNQIQLTNFYLACLEDTPIMHSCRTINNMFYLCCFITV